MPKFKVTLSFYYDSNEDVSEWGDHMPHQFVDTEEKAIDSFCAELDHHSAWEFDPRVQRLDLDCETI